MSNDVNINIRISKDLKAVFTTLCENEGITVSAKIKNLMLVEISKKLNISEVGVKPISKTPKKRPNGDFKTPQATTLAENIKTSQNVSKEQIDLCCNSDNQKTTSLLQSALNAQNKRKSKKKKR